MTIARRMEFLGLPLDVDADAKSVCELLSARDKLRLVTFINPAAWAVARRNTDYAAALNAMTLVLPDGEGVARACRLLTGLNSVRVSFDRTSLADPFFSAVQKQNLSLMIVAGKPGVDEDAQFKLQQTYPGLNIRGTTHGFGDFAPKIAAIMAAAPDVVVVGMGSPRQEEFLLALREAGFKGFGITCGGFFDQYLEADDYYPKWVDRWNLRFAWRLYKEPRRLWRRYLIDYQFFIWKALKAWTEKVFLRKL